ncbi:Uma2 family endonuclease [Nibrella saemangeumensis]|uniref:Uma2 family endonuclease n=1 Tax=Nibrella saemangeumensis TaxID=1084526 RepID=A0ABP8N1J2_9BACT
METIAKPWVSVAEYLEQEHRSELRHEYLDGQIRTMGYASEAHELIVANLVRLLGNCFLDTDARVYASNRLLHVPATNGFYYADALVVFGKPEFLQYKQKMQATLNPGVIVEVHSDSTMEYDQREKWASYQQITSLRQYVMVWQDRQRVETYRRTTDSDEWIYTSINEPERPVRIGECTVSLTDIYAKVEL